MRASVELEPDASSNSPPRLIQVDILTLKGMIEPVCGVPAATQRLIHRGRVLKDDQRVSNARLADGDTILLVQRPPDAPAATEGAAQGVGVGTGNANANANANGMPPNLVHMGQVRIPHGSSGAAQISQVVNAVLSRNGHGATTTANDFSSLGEGGNVTFELTMGPNGGAPTIRRVEGAPGAGSPAGPAGADGAAAGDPAAAARAARAGASGDLPGTRAAYTNPVDVITAHVESMRRLATELERERGTAVDAAASGDRDSAAMSTDEAETPPVAAREEATNDEPTNTCVHAGVQCDACGVQPITGVRFKSVGEAITTCARRATARAGRPRRRRRSRGSRCRCPASSRRRRPRRRRSWRRGRAGG